MSLQFAPYSDGDHNQSTLLSKSGEPVGYDASFPKFSDFPPDDVYLKTLPTPREADKVFLERIGLDYVKFQDWLEKFSGNLADSHDWPDIVETFSADTNHGHRYCGDPLADLQSYGMTKEIAETIIKREGKHYGELLPSQYAYGVMRSLIFRGMNSRCVV